MSPASACRRARALGSAAPSRSRRWRRNFRRCAMSCWRCRAGRVRASASSASVITDPCLTEPAMAALERVGLQRPRVGSRRRTVAWRAAPARDRHCAGAGPEGLPARRADGGHGAGGLASSDAVPRHAARTRRRSCWSSTTWMRCSRLPTASRCWSMAASSPAGQSTRSAAIRMCARPISESTHEPARRSRPRNLLWPEPGAVRRRSRRRRRRGRGAHGPQRHGQDDDHPLDLRPDARHGRGESRFAGADLIRQPPHRIARLGIGLVPEGRRCFPNLTVHENLVAAARPGKWTLDAVQAPFPRLGERMAAVCEHAFRRRAADAGRSAAR